MPKYTLKTPEGQLCRVALGYLAFTISNCAAFFQCRYIFEWVLVGFYYTFKASKINHCLPFRRTVSSISANKMMACKAALVVNAYKKMWLTFNF